MKKYLFRRFCLSLLVIFGATVLVFSVIRLAPGDPAMTIAVARYGGIDNISAEDIEGIRQKEALDAPLYEQYMRWLSRAAKGDLGRSLVNGNRVFSEILHRFPSTLKLAMASMLVALMLAIPVGVISASRPNSILDHLGMTGALLGVSMPNFWLALLLILLFAVHLGWLPVFGSGGLRHLVLPALTLGTGMAALTARLARQSTLEVLGRNFIRTARAKGLPEWVILSKHALRNALVPIVTITGLQFAFLLEGAVIVETVFAWPGIGRLMVEAIFSRDYPLIQGCALFVAIVFSVVNLSVDILCAFVDPRIRYERSRL